MANYKLKVGCIGAGVHFLRHGVGWSTCKDTEMVALCDTAPDALKRQGAEYGVSRLYGDPAELIADDDIDIVDVLVPNSLHADLVVAALDRGKHVVCEKPLATSVAEVRRIVEARDRARKLVMTAQNYRFSDAAIKMKAMVENGDLGDIYHARAWYLRRHGLPVSAGRMYRKTGGSGAIGDIGIHVLDLALWLMGHPKPVSVSGAASSVLSGQAGALGRDDVPVPQDMDVEEFAVGFVRFETGATLMFETAWMLHQGPDVEKRVWLYGSRGGTSFPDCALHRTDLAGRKTVSSYSGPFHKLRGEYDQETYSAQFADFANAVISGSPSPVPPEESLQAQVIIDAILECQATGHEVKL